MLVASVDCDSATDDPDMAKLLRWELIELRVSSLALEESSSHAIAIESFVLGSPRSVYGAGEEEGEGVRSAEAAFGEVDPGDEGPLAAAAAAAENGCAPAQSEPLDDDG